MRELLRRNNKGRKGQATTELALFGTIIIMALAYLLQQGFINNSRQSLEMYTFRKALDLSRQEERGINLTVVRDVVVPSFFAGLNRQRLMASAAVDYNPWKIWIPYEEDPEDVATRQLLQTNEAMIRNGYFLEIPPTKIKVDTGEGDPEWMWSPSAISEIDFQTEPGPSKVTQRKSSYGYTTTATEAGGTKTVAKELVSRDEISTLVAFEDSATIQDNYRREDWEDEIRSVEVDSGTIPPDANLITEETVRRGKSVQTPH